MPPHPVQRGRVYRRCGCRDAANQQYGARCPMLADDNDHGTWAYAVDLPNATGPRQTRRRSGFPSENEALEALHAFLEADRNGVFDDDTLTVAGYLTEWLRTKEESLKPTTYARYKDYVHNDLIPAFGRLKLADLRSRHITTWSHQQLNAGRGRTTVYRCGATLSSALNTAVRTRRIQFNPARYAVMNRPAAPERLCWTPQQAAAFLHHNAENYADQYAGIFEVLLGTGMRRGEALGLHWPDVHLTDRALFVRWSLTTVDNNHLHLGPPKTKASRNWVSLSSRVTTALQRQADRARTTLPHEAPLEGLVFTRPDGGPLNPQRLLHELHRRTAEAHLPRIGLHDLRHTAATIMISSHVPLAIVSKTLRHSTLATTVNLYGHLLPQAANEAVTALAHALDHADLPRPGN